jgi:Ca2+/Na+ antiporter
MKLKKSYGWMLAAAVVMVAVTLRFSPQTLPLLLIVLVCPVAMFIMMWGMGHQAGDQSHGHGHDHAEHSRNLKVASQ